MDVRLRTFFRLVYLGILKNRTYTLQHKNTLLVPRIGVDFLNRLAMKELKEE